MRTSWSASCGSAGRPARLVDETLPHEFGCIGQETTGAGGFAKALRTVPVVLELARELDRVGAPGAWFVNFTNPVGIVTQALLDEGHRAIGLCNVAIGLQRRIAAALDVRVRPGRARARGSQPPDLGARRPGRRRRPAAGTPGRRRGAVGRAARAAADRHAYPADVAVVLPALLLPAGRGAGRAAGRTEPSRAGDGDRADVARDVPRPGAPTQARSVGPTRWRLLQRGGRPADRIAACRNRRRSGRRHPQRGDAGRAGRRRRRRGAGVHRSRRCAPTATVGSGPRDRWPGRAGQGLRAARGTGGGAATTRTSRSRRCSPTRWYPAGEWRSACCHGCSKRTESTCPAGTRSVSSDDQDRASRGPGRRRRELQDRRRAAGPRRARAGRGAGTGKQPCPQRP